MSRQIFVNLPTRNIGRSRTFYAGLGWDINPELSDENAICVVVSDTLYLVILTKGYLQKHSGMPIPYPETELQGDSVFSEESRQAVDELVARATQFGGTEPRPPRDLGSMYYRAVLDPDGNRLGFVYLDPALVA